MKPNIHPSYHKVKVKLPQGGSFETYSACAQEEIMLEVDFRKHPAWTKKGISEANASSVKVSAFNKKFGSLGFSSSSTKKDS